MVDQKIENVQDVIQIRILELEDQLMDLLETSNKSEVIPYEVFELEMKRILKEIDYLENLKK